MADLSQIRRTPQTPEQLAIVEGILAGFAQARSRRYNFETQWQESALMAWPEYANTFFYGYDQMPGQKKTQQQLDSAVSIASHRFSAIVDSLMTPSSVMWSRLRHPDPYMRKQRGVKEYYELLSQTLWQHRYAPTANFIGQNQQNFQSLGVFGNMNMYVDELDSELFGGVKGLRYKSVPVGQVYYVENHQGAVNGYYRAYRDTAANIRACWPDTYPEAIIPALEARSQSPFWIIQFVCPRSDYQPWRLDKKGKRWVSYYMSVAGNTLLEEEGYRTFPMAIGRYMQAPDEVNGRGPMQMVLAAAKTKNAMKAVFLKQGHRAGDPIYLTSDDAMLDPEFHPGAVNKGGLDAQGRKLIDVLPTGQIQITEDMMDKEGGFIDDAFLVTMFRLALKLEDTPQMAARQVLEMIEQRGMFLAPTVGRQQSEYLGSLVPRELDVLGWQGLLPSRPQVMREADTSEYETLWTNPLTRAMKAGEAAAFMQMVEMGAEIARSTGNAEIWDNYEFDEALPEIGENRGVPISWIANSKSLAQKRKRRAAAAAEEAKTKQMPAQAAIIKAQAIQAKAGAGQNIGGTLSGVPGTQMPQIPGNPAGIPGNPGVGGGPGTTGIPG